jgi:hypothetical protein
MVVLSKAVSCEAPAGTGIGILLDVLFLYLDVYA